MKRTISTILVTASLSFVALPGLANISNNQQDRLSYAMGIQTGKALKAHKVAINPAAFAEGVDDAMKGAPSQMSQKAITQTLVAFRKESMEQLKLRMQAMAQKNANKGKAFMAANKNKTGVITTDSGLQYKILKKGNGVSPTLKDTVTVNYRGTLTNGKVFDSSYSRGRPVTFPLGGVIKGWQEALTKMKSGAIWMLYIPANLAYGVRGVPGAIEPNQTLIFKVNLISVKKA